MKSAVLVLASLSLGMIGWAVQPVKADLQVSETTVIKAPGIQKMLQEIPQEQRGSLEGMISPILTGTPWTTTTYLQGSRMRTDMGETTVLVNTATGNQVTMNRQTRQYSIGPYDPFQKSAGSMACRVVPTGQTKTILGHVVNGYSIALTSSVLPNSVISGEIWAAPGLPTPVSAGYASGIAAGFQSEFRKIKGLPLEYTLDYRNTPAGDISVVSYATSIQSSELSAAVFQIPSDYQRGVTQTAEAMPTTGFPLGDGMPLDTVSGMTGEIASGDGALGGGQLPAQLQQGLSQSNLNSALGSSSSGAGGSGSNLNSLVSPQMLRQLQSQMNSLLGN